MNTPKMMFKRTHIETGLSSVEEMNYKNNVRFNDEYLKRLEWIAEQRIENLNTKMPDQWKYELIGWTIDEHTT